jgi:hypothetical protein
MPRQIINVGTAPNDGTGDTIRASFTKLNDMTGEIYPVIDNPIAYSRLPTGAGTWDVGSGNVLTVTRQPNLVAGLAVGGTEVISSARALANVTANASIITAGTLGVARGGTGVADPVSGNLLVGAGASAMTALAPGAAAGYVRSNGTAWVRAAGLAAADVTGTLAVANGGTGVASPTSGNLLVGAGTSAMTALAPGAAAGYVRSNGTAWVRAAGLAAADITGTLAYSALPTGTGTWNVGSSNLTIQANRLLIGTTDAGSSGTNGIRALGISSFEGKQNYFGVGKSAGVTEGRGLVFNDHISPVAAGANADFSLGTNFAGFVIITHHGIVPDYTTMVITYQVSFRWGANLSLTKIVRLDGGATDDPVIDFPAVGVIRVSNPFAAPMTIMVTLYGLNPLQYP